MPGDLEKEVKKILPIIFMIDTSGSMDGERIEAVNEAMNDSVLIMEEVAKKNTNAEIAMAVMSFDSNIKWVNELININDFNWENISAHGMTYLGDALRELDKKLSRHGEGFLTDPIGYKLPVIILMSDGYPNDDWEDALKDIRSKNRWFEHAIRIAIGIGDDFDTSALIAFTGDKEAVLPTSKKQDLVDLIRVVSATASKIGSQSHPGTSDPTETIIRTIKTSTNGDEDEFEHPGTGKDNTEPDPGIIPSGFDMGF